MKRIGEYKAVIFDMDGVIVDSRPFHYKAWRSYMSLRGAQLQEKYFIDKLFGTSGAEAVAQLLPDVTAKEDCDRVCDEIDSIFRDIIRHDKDFNLIEGLIEFICSIKQNGIKVALGTSAPPENVADVFDRFNLGQYFDIMVDKSMVYRAKPDPQIYIKAMELLKMNPSDVLVFEDSLSGIRSAVAAGADVIGVTTSNTEEELLNEGALLCVKNFKNLTI